MPANKTLIQRIYDLYSAGYTAYPPITRPSPATTPPNAELIQRITVVETTLAAVKQRIDHLFGSEDQPDPYENEAFAAEPPTLEEIEQRREQRDLLKAQSWHHQLTRHIQPDPAGQRIVTTATAAAAFRLGTGSARDRLHTLTSFGLATFLDDGEIPRRWLLSDDQEASTDAAPAT